MISRGRKVGLCVVGCGCGGDIEHVQLGLALACECGGVTDTFYSILCVVVCDHYTCII